MTPHLVDTLVIAAGLFSPARIARADLARSPRCAGVGERKAPALLDAAQAWVAEHAVAAAEEAVVPGGRDRGMRCLRRRGAAAG